MKTIRFIPKKPLPPPSSPETVKERKKLDVLVEDSKEVIYHLKSIFPFDFFPDEIIITKNKIDLVYGVFFKSKEVFSILISNVHGVRLDYSLFFASLTFEVVIGYEMNPSPIKFLKREEAIHARRIVLGLLAALKDGVDISKLSVEELRAKAEEIGKAHST